MKSKYTGAALKEERKRRGITQADLAKKIGVSQPRISKMESSQGFHEETERKIDLWLDNEEKA